MTRACSRSSHRPWHKGGRRRENESTNEARIPAERSEDPSLTLRVSKDGSPIRSVSEVSSTNPKRDNRFHLGRKSGFDFESCGIDQELGPDPSTDARATSDPGRERAQAAGKDSRVTEA